MPAKFRLYIQKRQKNSKNSKILEEVQNVTAIEKKNWKRIKKELKTSWKKCQNKKGKVQLKKGNKSPSRKGK